MSIVGDIWEENMERAEKQWSEERAKLQLKIAQARDALRHINLLHLAVVDQQAGTVTMPFERVNEIASRLDEIFEKLSA